MLETFLVSTPLGGLLCRMRDGLLEEIQFASNGSKVRGPKSRAEREVAQEIRAYFLRKRKGFEIPFLIRGTEFERRVLHELWHLDYGEKISYSDLALRVGAPKAVRAVACVMARNKLPLLLPCHRVVSSDGGLGGYSGGLRKKRYLLALEER